MAERERPRGLDRTWQGNGEISEDERLRSARLAEEAEAAGDLEAAARHRADETFWRRQRNKEHDSIVRRKKCLACNHRWSTIEIDKDQWYSALQIKEERKRGRLKDD